MAFEGPGVDRCLRGLVRSVELRGGPGDPAPRRVEGYRHLDLPHSGAMRASGNAGAWPLVARPHRLHVHRSPDDQCYFFLADLPFCPFLTGFPVFLPTFLRAAADLALTLPAVMLQPFQLMSKMMPFGSLNLRSKSSSSGSPRSKKNLPPAFSICFCCCSRSSHWKPKWWIPTNSLGFLIPEPTSLLYCSSARLISPSLI